LSDTIDLSSARDLIRWAREDAEEFETGVQAYITANPYTPFREDDPETGHVFLKIEITPVPDQLQKLACHALWDLKHALDHATYAAILAVTGERRDVHFLWATHPTDLDRRLTHISKNYPNGKYPGVLHNLFRRFEPYPTGNGYPGGDDALIALNKMANTSKHAVSLNPVPRFFLENFTGSGGVVCVFQDRWDSLKNQLTIGLFRKNVIN